MTREQRLVFGEVADQYDRARPNYPAGAFDAIVEFAGVQPGDRVLEVGAGTGKATMSMVGRGFDVHALEPSVEMGGVLRAKGVDVTTTLFEAWAPDRQYPLLYAAQAWHWVGTDERSQRAAAALAPGGTIALMWNAPEEFSGQLGTDIHAVYVEHAPALASIDTAQWDLGQYGRELDASGVFTTVEHRVVPWTLDYDADEYKALMGTHSNHRILPDEQRERLHDAVWQVVRDHGDHVVVTYNTNVYLSRRLPDA